MTGDYILYNERLCRWCDQTAPDPEALPGSDFIYQRIHTLAHEPLHLATHIGIAESSYHTLYGAHSGLNENQLIRNIRELLEANRYPKGSTVVTMYIFAPDNKNDGPDVLLLCTRQLIYKGYALRPKGMNAITVPYEIPFDGHMTSGSMSLHSYARRYARTKGADTAIAMNYQGVVTGAGENPVFAISGNEIFTSPLESGVARSVERQLTIEASRKAGLLLIEQPVEVQQLKLYDEIFFTDPQGPVSIDSFDNHSYPHSMTAKIASLMNDIKL